MGAADSPARSNVATRPRRRQKGSIVGRNEKRIRSQNRSANHFKLRPSQHRRRRRQSFAQTRDRAPGRPEETVILRPGRRPPIPIPISPNFTSRAFIPQSSARSAPPQGTAILKLRENFHA